MNLAMQKTLRKQKKWILFSILVAFFSFLWTATPIAAKEYITVVDAFQVALTGPLEEVATEGYLFLSVQTEYPLAEIYYISEDTNDINRIRQAGEKPDFVSNSVLLTVTDSGIYTIYLRDYFGNEKLHKASVKNIDGKAPVPQFRYNEQLSRLVGSQVYDLSVTDEFSEIVDFRFKNGYEEDSSKEQWSTAPSLLHNQTFSAQTGGLYTFRTEDSLGNVGLTTCYLGGDEFRGVWVSYLEYNSKGYTYEAFQKEIDAMFTNIANMNMNAVIVHVRPFGDAMYRSAYYPWSKYSSGIQGKDPGFDPLAYMVEAAHKRGLEIHAWINPYRITRNTTNIQSLSKDNPARVWLEDANPSNDRNVLSYGGMLYYNPSKEEVRQLIINGIKEIVSNYQVDGIHFDDYFYPSLGSNYANNFDAQEYKEYVKSQTNRKQSYLSIADWRRNNVNQLVKNAYAAVKAIRPDCEFGISPGGFYKLLSSEKQYYVDYKTWMSEEGYLDYICPQIYWAEDHATYPYRATLDTWLSHLKTDVKVYVGIAVYKAGTKSEGKEWSQNANVLANQIQYARNTNLVSGFMFFRYDSFQEKANYASIKNLLKELSKQ